METHIHLYTKFEFLNLNYCTYYYRNIRVNDLTWKYMTTPKMRTVAMRFMTLGRFCL